MNYVNSILNQNRHRLESQILELEIQKEDVTELSKGNDALAVRNNINLQIGLLQKKIQQIDLVLENLISGRI